MALLLVLLGRFYSGGRKKGPTSLRVIEKGRILAALRELGSPAPQECILSLIRRERFSCIKTPRSSLDMGSPPSGCGTSLKGRRYGGKSQVPNSRFFRLLAPPIRRYVLPTIGATLASSAHDRIPGRPLQGPGQALPTPRHSEAPRSPGFCDSRRCCPVYPPGHLRTAAPARPSARGHDALSGRAAGTSRPLGD